MSTGEPPSTNLSFSTTPSIGAPDSLLQECSTLFSTNYATWSPKHPNPDLSSRQVRLPPRLLRKLCLPSSGNIISSIAAARIAETGELIGHVLYCDFPYPPSSVSGSDCDGGQEKHVLWVTQLVVKKGWRNQGIATRLLRLVTAPSYNHPLSFACGLATSNPYTVKALEAAFGLRCHRGFTLEHADAVIQASGVEYLQGKKIEIGKVVGRCVIDTEFLIDHATVEEARNSLGDAWRLGKLKEGEEFLAIVFPRMQEEKMQRKSMVSDHCQQQP